MTSENLVDLNLNLNLIWNVCSFVVSCFIVCVYWISCSWDWFLALLICNLLCVWIWLYAWNDQCLCCLSE